MPSQEQDQAAAAGPPRRRWQRQAAVEEAAHSLAASGSGGALGPEPSAPSSSWQAPAPVPTASAAAVHTTIAAQQTQDDKEWVVAAAAGGGPISAAPADSPEAAVEAVRLFAEDQQLNTMEMRLGYDRLFADGWRPQVTLGNHVPHPPHPERADLSAYSTLRGYQRAWFLQNEWFSMDLTMHMPASDDTWYESYRDPEWGTDLQGYRAFHETTFFEFIGILRAGAFIPGEGQHRKGRTSYRGAFCVEEMGMAIGRANHHRARDAEGHMQAWTFPVVLEIQCVQLVKLGPTKRVCPGRQWTAHPGVKVLRFHFSSLRLRQFGELSHPAVQSAWSEITVCGGGGNVACCGAFTHPSLPTYPWNPRSSQDKWQRSRKGILYCPRCHERMCREGAIV